MSRCRRTRMDRFLLAVIWAASVLVAAGYAVITYILFACT